MGRHAYQMQCFVRDVYLFATTAVHPSTPAAQKARGPAEGGLVKLKDSLLSLSSRLVDSDTA